MHSGPQNTSKTVWGASGIPQLNQQTHHPPKSLESSEQVSMLTCLYVVPWSYNLEDSRRPGIYQKASVYKTSLRPPAIGCQPAWATYFVGPRAR